MTVDSMKYHLRDCFNITVEEREKILVYQNRVCAVCGSPPVTRELAVDHCHVTGLVRGALCYSCNKRWLKDNPVLHKAMAVYLESPPAVRALGEKRYGYPGRIGTKIHKKELKKLRELGWEGRESGVELLENARTSHSNRTRTRSNVVRVQQVD